MNNMNNMNNNSLINATKIRSIYVKGYEFPKWSISKKLWKTFNFEETYVLYHQTDNIKKVKKLIKYREPCNIAVIKKRIWMDRRCIFIIYIKKINAKYCNSLSCTYSYKINFLSGICNKFNWICL